MQLAALSKDSCEISFNSSPHFSLVLGGGRFGEDDLRVCYRVWDMLAADMQRERDADIVLFGSI